MSEEDTKDTKITFSLIQVDGSGLSDAGKLLVERASAAFGGVFAPWQIRRIAAADADAAAITAQAEIRVTDIQRRAAKRWLAEEERKQRNMESVLAKAAAQVSPDAKPENIQEDWLAEFFEKSRQTSDDEMQNLWAKILAGEANAPGKFGKRVLSLMASLEKSDAESFTALCRFSVAGFNVGKTPLVFEPQAKIYNDQGVNWATLKHLSEIGLVSFESVGGLVLNLPQTKATPANWVQGLVIVSYQGSTCFARPNTTQLPVGSVKFSKAGSQLAPLISTEPVPGFFEYLVAELKKNAIVQVAQEGQSISPEIFYPNGF